MNGDYGLPLLHVIIKALTSDSDQTGWLTLQAESNTSQRNYLQGSS